MKTEELDPKHAQNVQFLVDKTLKFLDDTIPRSDDYSHINLSLNVLFGTIITIGKSFLPKEQYPNFVAMCEDTFRKNFK